MYIGTISKFALKKKNNINNHQNTEYALNLTFKML